MINKKEQFVKEKRSQRNKRSFILSDDAVNQLALLKLVEDTDLSGIVEKSIYNYYMQNQEKLENIIDMYERYKTKK